MTTLENRRDHGLYGSYQEADALKLTRPQAYEGEFAEPLPSRRWAALLWWTGFGRSGVSISGRTTSPSTDINECHY